MTLRFQADADLNEKIIAATIRREPGLDFRTATDAGLRGLSDLEVLGRAAADRRVLVTHDLRTMPTFFGEYLSASTSPGVVVIPQHMPIAQAVDELLLIWSETDPTEWRDRIYVVPA